VKPFNFLRLGGTSWSVSPISRGRRLLSFLPFGFTALRVLRHFDFRASQVSAEARFRNPAFPPDLAWPCRDLSVETAAGDCGFGDTKTSGRQRFRWPEPRQRFALEFFGAGAWRLRARVPKKRRVSERRVPKARVQGAGSEGAAPMTREASRLGDIFREGCLRGSNFGWEE